jgi:hypothetical protein
MTVSSTRGHPRRRPKIIWRARCGTVVGRSPQRRLTSGAGAGTLNTGKAHDRRVPGGVMPHVNTVQRTPLVAPERGWLEASGSRSCPRLAMQRPQRRSSVSSMTKMRSPPAATKVRTHRPSRRRLNPNADQHARLST